MSGMKGHVPLVTKLLLFVPEADLRRFAVSARTYPCYPRYPWLRVALNVACFDGRSPTSGANSTSPVIASGVSKFPLNVNVPGSRPTLPIGNSTVPENVTEFWSPTVHFASEGFAGPHRLNAGSSSRKVPLPWSCASKRNDRLLPSAKLISTFHLPTMFGDWA